MRRSLLLSLLILQSALLFAQPGTYSSSSKMGDTISITGRVIAGNFLKNVITKPTFLNVYDSSPMHMLMIRIDSGDRKNFPVEPEKLFLNKKVTVRGVLTDYKGLSLIKITDPSAITVDRTDRGPAPITSTASYMSGKEFGFGKEDEAFRKKQDSIKTILSKDKSRTRKTYMPDERFQTTDTSKNEPVKQEIETPKAEEPVLPPVTDTTVQAPESAPMTDTVPAPVETPTVSKKPEEPKAETPAPIPAAKEETKPVEPTTSTEPKEVPVVDTATAILDSSMIESSEPLPPGVTVDTNPSDTLSRAEWIKTISKLDFVPVDERRLVSGGEIELYATPDNSSPVVAYLLKLMTIHVTFRSAKWSYVTVENPDGSTGKSGFVKNKNYKAMPLKSF